MSRRRTLICLLLLIALAIVMPPCRAAGDGVVKAGSACGPAGSGVSIPITLSSHGKPVGNMDLVIEYDPRVVRAVQVNRGELTAGAIFDSNIREGEISIGIATAERIEGSGTIAYIAFELIGTGGTSKIRFSEISADHALTMEPLRMEAVEGSLDIIPGIRIVTEGNLQEIFVDRDGIDGRTEIEGDRIICDQCGLRLEIALGEIREEAGVLRGVVNEVRIISPPVSADLSFGRVEAWFEFSTPRYPADGRFILSFSEEIDPALRQSLEKAAGGKGLEIVAIPFLARIEHGYGRTGPAKGHFTIPGTLADALGGVQHLWFGHQSEYVAPELLKAELESGPDPAGRIALKVESPEGLSIFALASAKVKSIADQGGSGGSPQGPPQTGITLFFNMIVSAATLSTGNLIVGAIVLFLIVGIAIAGIVIAQRRKGT